VEFTFTSLNLIEDGSLIGITFPFEQFSFKNNEGIRCGKGQYAHSLDCESLNETNDNITVRVEEWCSGDCLPGELIIITLKDTINPFSLLANFPTQDIVINVTTSNGYPIEQYRGVLKVEPDLSGIFIHDVVTSRGNNMIGKLDYLHIQIPITQ